MLFIVRLLKKVSPETRLKAASVLLSASIALWPLTSLTVFRAEPQGILGLSWLALILTCVDIILTADVREEQD